MDRKFLNQIKVLNFTNHMKLRVLLSGAIFSLNFFSIANAFDLPPSCRTKVMEQSPLISENSGYETIQIYR